jgi:hypothetical protein
MLRVGVLDPFLDYQLAINPKITSSFGVHNLLKKKRSKCCGNGFFHAIPGLDWCEPDFIFLSSES